MQKICWTISASDGSITNRFLASGSHLGDFRDVAERRHGPIPEVRFGIALHGVAGELCGLA